MKPKDTAIELAYRESAGVNVTLLWHPVDDALTVHVVETTSGESFTLVPARDQVLDVFHHPFAHASFRGPPPGVRCMR